MFTLRRLFLLLVMGAFVMGLSACPQTQDQSGDTEEVVEEEVVEEAPADTMQEKAGEAMDSAQDTANDAMDAGQDAADDAMDKADDMMDDAQDKADDMNQ